MAMCDEEGVEDWCEAGEDKQDDGLGEEAEAMQTEGQGPAISAGGHEGVWATKCWASRC